MKNNDLLHNNNYDSIPIEDIPLESLKALIERHEDEMKRKEILKDYNLHQLPNGAWYTRIGGKKRQFKNLRDLEDAVIEYAGEQKETLSSIFNDFLAIRKITVAEATWVLDITNFRDYIKDSALGNMPYKNITLSDGYKFFKHCESIKGKMRRKYWNKILNTVNKMFQYLNDEGKLTGMPFENLTISPDRFDTKLKTKEQNTVFFDNEQKLVCSYAKEAAYKKKDSIPLGILILFSLGLRIGELCDLKWSDIEEDDTGKYLHIQHITVNSFTDDGKSNGRIELDRCKTEAGDRKLKLTEALIKILSDIKKYNKINNYPIGENDYIFLRKYRDRIEMCTPKCFDSRIRGYCKKAKMSESKSCHDIRRTALTNLYKKNVPLKTIQYIAGHSTLKQTMDYLRITDDDLNNMKDYLNLIQIDY